MNKYIETQNIITHSYIVVVALLTISVADDLSLFAENDDVEVLGSHNFAARVLNKMHQPPWMINFYAHWCEFQYLNRVQSFRIFLQVIGRRSLLLTTKKLRLH